MIVHQKLVEASNIVSNHYNETHHLEITSERVSKAMSTVVNKERAMLFSNFTKELVMANIKLTYAFLEEVKHYSSSFLVHEILQ